MKRIIILFFLSCTIVPIAWAEPKDLLEDFDYQDRLSEYEQRIYDLTRARRRTLLMAHKYSKEAGLLIQSDWVQYRRRLRKAQQAKFRAQELLDKIWELEDQKLSFREKNGAYFR